MDTTYTIRSRKVQSDGEIEIKAEIPAGVLQAHRIRILTHMREEFEFPGFRKGNVPEDVFLRHVNDHSLLEEATQDAIDQVIPLLFHGENLHPMIAPEVTVTKMAFGNAIECTIRVAPFPEIDLPDYKKIAREVVAKETKEVTVLDNEVEQVVQQILALRSPAKSKKEAAGADAPDQTTAEKPEPPELTDEMVRTLGRFENVADFKSKIRENLKLERELDNQAERREKIAEALVEKTKIQIPERVIARELEAIDARFNAELARVGASREEHLKKIKKTEAELSREQREHIKRQLKTRLLYDAIAKKEKLVISDEEVSAMSAQLHGRNPDMKPLEVQNYAAIMLINEKVLALLEGPPAQSEKSA